MCSLSLERTLQDVFWLPIHFSICLGPLKGFKTPVLASKEGNLTFILAPKQLGMWFGPKDGTLICVLALKRTPCYVFGPSSACFGSQEGRFMCNLSREGFFSMCFGSQVTLSSY